MLNKTLPLTLIVLFTLTYCSKKSELKEFTYGYTMESIGNFKIDFQVNSDSTYQVIQNNYFFDRYEGSSKPIKSKGLLSKEEYGKLIELIIRSNIEKMNDSYGFESNTGSDNSMLYTVELNKNGKSKFVTVNLDVNNNLSDEFNELIIFTNFLINNKLDSKTE